MAGNDAVHAHEDEKREALHQLRMAWKLGIWFQKLRHPRFKPDRFITPPEPVDATQELLEETFSAALFCHKTITMNS